MSFSRRWKVICSRLKPRPAIRDALSALFRAAHTIKGSAGVFGFDFISAFMHSVENLLSHWRDGKLRPTRQGVDLVLRCRDHAQNLVSLAEKNAAPSPEDNAKTGEIIRQVEQAISAGGVEIDQAPAAVSAPNSLPAQVEPAASGSEWRITYLPDSSVFKLGLDPLGPVRELSSAGRIEDLAVDLERIPPIADLDPEACLLSCEIEVSGLARPAVESAFEFFDGVAQVSLEALHPEAAPPSPNHPPGLPEALPEPAKARPAPEASGEKPGGSARFLRVETGRIDQLVNLVGELVIAGANMAQIASRQNDPGLVEASASMLRMIGDLREQSLRVRMVRLGETFARFHRVVRDLAAETGKEVHLSISGGETELDKTVVEKIVDPLMHLVRNAVDHGLETAADRIAAGKPRFGSMELDAYQETGSIVIEVRDDGRGFVPEKILARARERGLVQPGLELSRAEILDFVFQPGFSTAEQVSAISGRGVGLDVVRQNIDALRGTVHIDSTPGRGSVMRIRLPLTLAIIEGFQVRVGSSHYIVPMDMILECVDLPDEAQAQDGRSYINLRGEVLPYLDLQSLFAESGETGRSIVVVEYGGRRAGLRVGALLGEYQTVIKPLGRLFAHVRGINGATILGNGTVCLILDIPSLIELAIQKERIAAAETV
jgi:two-component system chemotaxis sensor kinase CheA